LNHASQKRLILPFILPALLLFAVFFVYPVLRTIYIALTDWQGVGELGFVGFDQFDRLVADPAYLGALKNTFALTVIGAAMLFPPAVAIAWALNQKLHGEHFFRFIVFAPVVLSAAIVALMWKFLYHPTIGLINPALASVGLGELAKTWLGDPQTALAAVAFTSVWHGLGVWVVLLGAGFEGLPKEVLEAGRIDGLGEWKLFWYLTLPLLRDLFRILIVLWFIQSMQAFAFVFIMTGGGPFGSSEIVGTLMYRIAFERTEFGYAAAMGVVLVAIILSVTYVLNKVLRRDDLQY
jgi:ABC-type sugar transport system permease subunit